MGRKFGVGVGLGRSGGSDRGKDDVMGGEIRIYLKVDDWEIDPLCGTSGLKFRFSQFVSLR